MVQFDFRFPSVKPLVPRSVTSLMVGGMTATNRHLADEDDSRRSVLRGYDSVFQNSKVLEQSLEVPQILPVCTYLSA